MRKSGREGREQRVGVREEEAPQSVPTPPPSQRGRCKARPWAELRSNP